MAMTLLEIVQRVAQYINGETVTSISDTRESEQLSSIVKETYNNLILTKAVRAKWSMAKLQSLSDTSKPTYFKIQTPIARLESVKYLVTDLEGNKSWRDLHYVTPNTFLSKTVWKLGDDNVEDVIDFSGITLYIQNDKAPDFYTLFDDDYIVFDSYNKAVENTLQQTNILVEAVVIPAFEMRDDFIPNLAEQHFPLLLSRAKLNADMEIKGKYNQLEGEVANKQAIITDVLGERDRGQGEAAWKNRMNTGRRI